jgi:hypothetical protein
MTILAVIIKTVCIISGAGEEATANSSEYRTTRNNVLLARCLYNGRNKVTSKVV